MVADARFVRLFSRRIFIPSTGSHCFPLDESDDREDGSLMFIFTLTQFASYTLFFFLTVSQSMVMAPKFI